jgi:hypothetical protein
MKTSRKVIVVVAVIVGVLLLGFAAIMVASKIRCGTLACLITGSGSSSSPSSKHRHPSRQAHPWTTLGHSNPDSNCDDVSSCLSSATGQPCGAVPQYGGTEQDCVDAQGTMIENSYCAFVTDAAGSTPVPPAQIAGNDGFITISGNNQVAYYPTVTPTQCAPNDVSSGLNITYTPY